MGSRIVVLKSQDAEYEALLREIADICHASGFGEDFRAVLELTVKEAFVNAIVHGNRRQTALPVVVTFVVENVSGSLLVSLRDCGSGFNPEDLPDPTEADFLQRTSGRGVYIIRRNAEIVEVRRDADGFTLTLRYPPCRCSIHQNP